MGKAISTKSCPSCKQAGGDWNDDNLVQYADGSVYCFACQYSSRSESKWVHGEYVDLEKRRISKETCQLYGYKVGKYTGEIGIGKNKRTCKDEWVSIMEWYDDAGRVIMQKIKTKYKEMKLIGDTQHKGLYGLTKFQLNPNIYVTVTEGEEDAMSLAEAQNRLYPNVSLPGGAGNAVEVLKLNLDKLSKAKGVILCFDNDEKGRQAVDKVIAANLFEPGKLLISTLPLKDASDMLVAGRVKELETHVFKAKVYRPSHIVTVSDIIDKVMEKPEFGLDYPWKSWTRMTYGLRFNEITTIVGPSGVGKTEVVKDIISHFLEKMNVGVFSFEQSPADTVRRYAGSKLGLKLQKPGTEWDDKKIKETAMLFDQRVFLYDFNGRVDLDDIFNSIRYMNKAHGCRLFIIDNLKSLRVVFSKEQCAEFAVTLKALVKDLHVHVILVSHVNKDTVRQSTHVGFSSKVDKPHEGLTESSIKDIMNKFALDWPNGRMPTASNIEGSNDIEAISDYVFALGRNKLSTDAREKRIIKVALLKEGRIDSDNPQTTFKLYRNDEGILEEIDDEVDLFAAQPDNKSPF